MSTLVKLEIIVEYDLNGDTFEDVSQQLDYAAMHLAFNGMLSGHLNAEVETWHSHVHLVE